MKKILFLLFAMIIVQYARGEDIHLIVEDLQFSIQDGSHFAEITKYIGQGTTCIIPETVKYKNSEYPVVVLGENVFSNASNLISITLPNNLSEFTGDFKGCINLQEFIVKDNNTAFSVIDGVLFSKDKTFLCYFPSGKKGEYIIPEGTTGIAYEAFSGCTDLISIVLPNSLTTINYYSFSGCISLKEYLVYDDNSNFSTIDGVLFSKDNKVLWLYPFGKKEDYIIPEKTKSIKDYAFHGCPNLTSVTFPESLNNIGDYSFAYCNSLKSITLPKYIQSIGYRVFSYCTNLNSVIFPENFPEITFGIFSNCINLTSITLPNNWAKVPLSIIENCPNLTEYLVKDNNPNFCSLNGVLFSKDKTELKLYPMGRKGSYILPEGTIKITSGAFSNCTNLTSITFSNSLKNIPENVFSSCISLIEYIVKEDNPNFSSIDGVLFSKNRTELILYPIGKNGNYIIPDEVEKIAYNAFSNCTNLTSITLPNSLKNISADIFNSCIGLTQYIVKEDNPNFSSIDGVLFSKDGAELILYPIGKNGNYVIPNGVEKITYDAFSNCTNLTSITFPNSLKNIPTNVFSDCTSLIQYVVKEDNPNFSSESGVLYTKDKTKLLLYPIGKKDNYAILNGTEIIAYGAFKSCEGLTSVSFPNSLTKIETDAFNGCTALKHINIPETVTSIGDNAFSRCISLKIITIPASVGNNIGKSILSYCNSLRYVFSYAALEPRGYNNNPFQKMASSVILFCSTTYTSNYSSMYSEGTIANIEKCFWDLNTSSTTQGTISFKLNPNNYWKQSDNIAIKKVYLLVDNDTINAEKTEDIYKFNNLMPNQEYDIQLNFDILSCNVTIYPTLKTQNIGLASDKITQTKLLLSIKAEDIPVAERSLYYRIKGENDWERTSDISSNAVTISNLIPNTTYECYVSVYVNGKWYDSTTVLNEKIIYQTFTTQSLNIKILNPIVGQTIFSCSGDYQQGDATVEGFGFTGDGISNEYNKIKELRLTGLTPNTKYKITFNVKTKEGGITKTEYTFTTHAIAITTQPADAISNTSVTLNADFDCDAESGYGFEWRKYDAPDMVPSNTVQAEKIKDKVAFRLVNLTPSTYYKYRPFYKSASEKMYYGEWIAFGTADIPVLFAPTVETLDYKLDEEEGTNVTLQGYVLAGSENILQQGFEYRIVTEQNQKEVLSTGTNMEAQLIELKPNTTYKYRAFAKTASGTTYGNELEFTTKEASAVNNYTTDNFQASVYPNPAKTEALLQIKGIVRGTINYAICDLNGRLLLSDKKEVTSATNIPIDIQNLAKGMYIIHLIYNNDIHTIKMMVE